MSLINDALKRARQAQKRPAISPSVEGISIAPPPLQPVEEVRPEPSQRLLVVIPVLLLSLGASFWFFSKWKNAEAKAAASATAIVRDGRALQSGTSHYMGTNFAKVFNIQYAAESGELELCHTTSWGMSARMIGGVIMTHGDDKGLILPPLRPPHRLRLLAYPRRMRSVII
jgi:hypothetical protein